MNIELDLAIIFRNGPRKCGDETFREIVYQVLLWFLPANSGLTNPIRRPNKLEGRGAGSQPSASEQQRKNDGSAVHPKFDD